EPPSAVAFKATKNASASAALQRDRVRKAMLAVDQQNRLARGMSAKAPVSAIEREYGVVFNGFAVKLLPESIKWLKSQPDVRRVVANGRVQATLDVSVPLVRAPEVWADLGYRGAGVTIAVIDTGVDYTHPDLGGCLGAACKVVGGFDFVNNDPDPMDDQ